MAIHHYKAQESILTLQSMTSIETLKNDSPAIEAQ